MIEIPESAIISRQAAGVLTGRRIAEVIPATSPHKFTWYNGDPAGYPEVLEGRSIETVDGHGAFIDLVMDKDTHLLISDGTIMRYGQAGELHPCIGRREFFGVYGSDVWGNLCFPERI